MKKLLTLLTLAFCISNLLIAQAPPNAFNYSAVARNAAGLPIANTTIGIQIGILKTSVLGALQYQENHFVNTDAFGLFNLTVGAGAVQSGTMAAINWSNDDYYLKVDMDANGSTNFLTMGATQLLSVPYALHAKTAESIVGGAAVETDPIFGTSVAKGITTADTANWNNKQQKLIAGAGISITNNTITSTPNVYIQAGSNVTITGTGTQANPYIINAAATATTGGTGNLVLPTITTAAATNITSNEAIFAGTITNANGNQIMERGIVYSLSPNPTINSNKILVGSGVGTFSCVTEYNPNAVFHHVLNAGTTYYARAYAITENNIYAYGNEVTFTTLSLSVGQTGPGGGLVFYDKGNTIGGWQYLEAAPTDQSTGIDWGCNSTSIPGTQSNVGTGESNTNFIVTACPGANASELCSNLTLGGQSDWFLPSIDELNLMYVNLHQSGQGGFSSSYYWSSSEYIYNHAWYYFYYLTSGGSSADQKYDPLYVRAVRAF
jgi:hypothetical protein